MHSNSYHCYWSDQQWQQLKLCNWYTDFTLHSHLHLTSTCKTGFLSRIFKKKKNLSHNPTTHVWFMMLSRDMSTDVITSCLLNSAHNLDLLNFTPLNINKVNNKVIGLINPLYK